MNELEEIKVSISRVFSKIDKYSFEDELRFEDVSEDEAEALLRLELWL